MTTPDPNGAVEVASSRSLLRVARTGVTLGLVTLVCRIVSAIKELAVAYVLGASAATDAFTLVMLLPGLAASLLYQTGRNAFLADFPQRQNLGPAAAARSAHSFALQLALVGLLTAVVGGMAMGFGWHVLFPWTHPQIEEYAKRMLIPAAMFVFVQAIVMAWMAILHARQQFLVPQLTSLLPTLCVLTWIGLVPPDRAWRALVEGLFYGSLVQGAVLLALVRRAGFFRVNQPWFSTAHETHRLWILIVPIFLANIATQVNSYVDRMMAASLEEGAVAVLNWASLLHDLVSSTLIAGLLSVWLPHIAQQVAARRMNRAASDLHQLINAGATVLLPISCATGLAAYLGARHVHWGKLDEPNVRLLAACFSAYLLGLFAQLASNCLYQALIVLRRTRTLVAMAFLVNMPLNIALNLLLIRPLGASGLALATSLVAVATFVGNAQAVRSDLPFRWSAVLPTIGCAAVVSIAITVVLAGVGYVMVRVLPPTAGVSLALAFCSWVAFLGLNAAIAYQIPSLRMQWKWLLTADLQRYAEW